MYKRYLRVNIIPKLPIFFAIISSSKELRPKRLDYFTSLRHFAHLCTAYFVNPTRNGIKSKLITPKIKIPITAIKYPSRFVS